VEGVQAFQPDVDVDEEPLMLKLKPFESSELHPPLIQNSLNQQLLKPKPNPPDLEK
jgi:hypothetical protein